MDHIETPLSFMKLIFATGNENKVREIRQLLPDGFSLLSLADIGFSDEIPETSDTIEGNSLQKARFLKDVLQTDGFAEDTGLEVDALLGEPGIYSARYAGPQKSARDNMDLLLQRMLGQTNRKARFRTVITLIIGSDIRQFEGILNGQIGHHKIGDQGFGYDPIFVLKDGRTLAELSPEEKSKLSHRAIAFNELMHFLQNGYI
jgi:XTP/dITP diphosphohydrolase